MCIKTKNVYGVTLGEVKSFRGWNLPRNRPRNSTRSPVILM